MKTWFQAIDGCHHHHRCRCNVICLSVGKRRKKPGTEVAKIKWWSRWRGNSFYKPKENGRKTQNQRIMLENWSCIKYFCCCCCRFWVHNVKIFFISKKKYSNLSVCVCVYYTYKNDENQKTKFKNLWQTESWVKKKRKSLHNHI